MTQSYESFAEGHTAKAEHEASSWRPWRWFWLIYVLAAPLAAWWIISTL